MCYTTHYKSVNCTHQWLAVTQSCGPGKGFDNCTTFKDDYLRYGSKRVMSSRKHCPWHGLYGDYDYNRMRMVKKVRRGFILGGWPGTNEPGSKFTCCVQ
ncbi:hypothetical protein B0O99DRAFT_8872 [Bisporella sp. PMI_857]|nr:hypothetical protein B0O99DRAFT_8872 [Bisporella sp. PMI_857]